MKFESFKPGHWQPRYQYKSFEPVSVDHAWTWEDPAIHLLLESANRALGELNAFSLIVPDIDLFIEMHVVKEAQSSSRIEGTQTGIGEADFDTGLGISKSTALALVKDFRQLGILSELTVQMRDRIYSFDRYLKLFLS